MVPGRRMAFGSNDEQKYLPWILVRARVEESDNRTDKGQI